MVLGASDVRYLPRTLDKGLTLAGLVVQSVESPTEREVDSLSLSARQNQGLAWSSDTSLWGNYTLRAEVLDRTKALHGPRTQAYGETRHTENKA